ncbi:MAG: hypothetical protein R6V77_00495 [Candidatus Cloacimonadaceae bacterium]
MKKFIMVCLFTILILSLSAYTVGQYAKTFTDPNRNNRQILTWIYFPIDADNPLESYPYIVYGHGWNGDCTYYTTLTNAIVNLGWIIAYPRTEEGMFSYNTTSLALDMAFLKEAVYLETMNFTSPLYNKIDTLSVVGGYSMGGACAVAAASMDSSFNSLVTLAAAPITILNLYPESINLALNITAPSLTFSGSADTVAPPNTNQIPIYNNLASDYKSFVSFTGQVHDSFYNNPMIPVILNPWFSYLKTGSVYYIDVFEAFLDSYSGSLTFQIEDNLIIILDAPENLSVIYESNTLSISWDGVLEAHSYRVFASNNPYNGFNDVTSQGTFSYGDRVSWILPSAMSGTGFYYIKSYRD